MGSHLRWCHPQAISYTNISAYGQDELSRLYKMRREIELFHRTTKQSLGWKECQMISNEKTGPALILRDICLRNSLNSTG